jgi:hypothetical protein
MISLTTTLLHGLLICIPFSIFVVITFVGWPRLWLHSLPSDIIKRAAPKTDREENYKLRAIADIPGNSSRALGTVGNLHGENIVT